MKISVNKYTLTPDTVDGGTAGSHGLESLTFDFSPEWDDLSRTVTFFPPKSAAKCVSFVGDTLPLPSIVTARAGKVAYVLCGAKDGAAVITVTGVIEIAPTMYPTDSETEEYVPGALEQATLACAEARVDARVAADSAQIARVASDSAKASAEQASAHRNVVSDLYDAVMEGTAVHSAMTEANRSDMAHPPSVWAVNQRLDALLAVISPFNIKVVDELPDEPEDCIYLYGSEPMVYVQTPSVVVCYKWGTEYKQNSGPAEIFTFVDHVSQGDQLYWYGAVGEQLTAADLKPYDKVASVSDGEVTTENYGAVIRLSLAGAVQMETEGGTKTWNSITPNTDLTPYLRNSAVRYLITGGGA